MKKLVVFLLVAVMMLTSSVMVFAEDNAEGVTERPERTELSQEEKEAKRQDLFNLYNPAAYTDLLAAKEAHEAFHTTAKAEREVMKADRQAEREAFKASVQAGEMTREEVQAIVAERKAENEVLKAEVESIKALKQADVEANKAEMQAVRASIKTALQAEEVDATYVASLLDQMVDLLEAHIDIDYYYYNMIQDLVNN